MPRPHDRRPETSKTTIQAKIERSSLDTADARTKRARTSIAPPSPTGAAAAAPYARPPRLRLVAGGPARQRRPDRERCRRAAAS